MIINYVALILSLLATVIAMTLDERGQAERRQRVDALFGRCTPALWVVLQVVNALALRF